MDPNVDAFGTRPRVVRECAVTGAAHQRRVMRDATGAVDFEYCAACGDRRYRDADSGALSAWAPDGLWRHRFYARRVCEAMWAAAQATHPHGRSTGRREATALVASWFGTPNVGAWHAWTAGQCQTIIERATPILQDYAELLVTGDARHLLHASRARASWFPRVAYRWYVLRDALRHRAAQWVAKWQA